MRQLEVMREVMGNEYIILPGLKDKSYKKIKLKEPFVHSIYKDIIVKQYIARLKHEF